MSAAVHEVLANASKPSLIAYFSQISTVKGNLEVINAKIEKSADNTYKSVYFFISSYFCWYLMAQGTFLPWFMGGSYGNDLKNMYLNYPMVVRIEGLPTLFLMSVGYHFWGTYRHFIGNHKRNDYFEMCVHHLITISVFVGGHIMGDCNSGLLIVYMMDFSDIAVHFAKASCDTHWKK